MHRRFHDKYFDKGLRGWVVRTAQKNYWRVAAWYDLEDLIQDGLLAYAICRNRYRDRVENKHHFMALVQRVYLNHITDLANARTVGEEISISQIAVVGKELEALEYLAGGVAGDAELETLLARAPAEVRAYLNMFKSPEGIEALEKPCRRYKDGTRQTQAQHLSMVLGVPVVDMEASLRSLLTPPEEPAVRAQWAAFFAEVLLGAKPNTA